VRDRTTIDIYTPEPFPMPTAGPVLGQALAGMLAERGISLHTETSIDRIDPHANQLVLTDGERAGYDLLLGIPPHRAPEVARTSGLAAETGFLPVDPATLATAVDGIFAIGDVTAIPIAGGKFLPKAGVFAHAEAEVVAERVAAELGGRTSRLIAATPDAERIAACALRAVLGLSEREMDDERALDELLNPARNRYRLETLNVGVHSPMMRALQHVSYTFCKKLSHTADSQDQRHRMVPASRPLLAATSCPDPDYITPMLVRGNAEVEDFYHQAMQEAWQARNQLLDRGVSPSSAVYVLPNATAVRLVETGSLLHLLHKWTMRTCFNAQEEIYAASMEELEQVRAAHPRLARHLGPPCYLRHGLAYPVCTEGSHFCGVRVWDSFPAVERKL